MPLGLPGVYTRILQVSIQNNGIIVNFTLKYIIFVTLTPSTQHAMRPEFGKAENGERKWLMGTECPCTRFLGSFYLSCLAQNMVKSHFSCSSRSFEKFSFSVPLHFLNYQHGFFFSFVAFTLSVGHSVTKTTT